MTPSSLDLRVVARFATAPIRLAAACRLIHRSLTGPKARRREPDEEVLKDAWEALEASWSEFEAFKHEVGPEVLGAIEWSELERYCDGWSIFMFECESPVAQVLSEGPHADFGRSSGHAVIREALDQRLAALEMIASTSAHFVDDQGRTSSAASLSLVKVRRLYAIADAKVRRVCSQRRSLSSLAFSRPPNSQDSLLSS